MRQPIQEVLFSKVYPLYVTKVTRKGRTEEELLTVIQWMTGYDHAYITHANISFTQFFNEAPHIHPNIHRIKGKICGVDIESIEDPIYKYIRQLDKLVDELAKGKPIEKILLKKT